MKYIYLLNPNTQVYVCGIPNLLGLNLSNIINTKIKKSCNLYSNTCYINSIKSKVFYKVNDRFIFDVHYNELEYLKFNVIIFKNIISKFNKKVFFIKFDKILKKYNFCEYNNIENCCFNELKELVDKNKMLFSSNLKTELVKYYKSRYSYDYYYTPKKDIINLLKNTNILLDK